MQSTAKFRDKAEKNRLKLSQAEEAANAPDDEFDLKREKCDDLAREADQQSQLKKELEQELKRAIEPQKHLKQDLKYLKKEMNNANSSLRRTTDRLQKKRDEILARVGSAESEEAQRTQRIRDAEEQLASKKAKGVEIKQAVSDALRAYEEIEPHVMQAKQNCDDIKRRLQAVEHKANGLRNSSGSQLAVFGKHCEEVKKRVS